MNAKECHTVEHCERITSTSLAIADVLGLSAAEKSTLELAAYMHDIGKIGVSEAILLKPDKLSEAEWEEMKMHPDTGSNILSNIEELADLAKIIRHHHERVDGTGYPDGLPGDEIPLLSKILAIADAFDAMTSDRPYRPRLLEEEALEQLRLGGGGQFDSVLVELFLDYRQGQMRKAA
jgi:putative nucleotidyltransferase with HDIG domain